MQIRPEHPGDELAIRAVLTAAFPADAEARLVEALRSANRLAISLVAELDGKVIGHIAFSPVTVDSKAQGLGLAPLAVIPEAQRRGVGSSLVQHGLARATRLGVGFVVVLGHAHYYPRFGFRRALERGLGNEYNADHSFQVMELLPDALPGDGGLVRYCAEFAAFG